MCALTACTALRVSQQRSSAGSSQLSHLHPLLPLLLSDTYLRLQSALDPFTPPGHYYERTLIAQSAPAGLADALITAAQQATATAGLEHSALVLIACGAGGAMTDFVGNGCFSEQQRRGNWIVGLIGQYEPQRITRAQALQWANGSRDALLPFCSTHYTNSSNGKPGSRVIFSASLERLRQVKQRYDPLNVFCNNHNVVPASMDETKQQNAQPQDN